MLVLLILFGGQVNVGKSPHLIEHPAGSGKAEQSVRFQIPTGGIL